MRRHYAELFRRAASLPSLSLVASLHGAALRRGAVLVPSLIHAYSACGDPASARSVFDGLPAQEQTLSARTALASAMSAHGRCREVLGLFRGREGEMDDKAVTVVLAACASDEDPLTYGSLPFRH
ncbi:putative pentatricopeptide repeat-containing protein At3g13770, mitochondrial [Triticum dicoccoides]|uniref:putative pentatricopeptide repeat-containing protein At3g13770, mitochondrial n=1 Tax=Triticum dicoccoides TaxID=85692 RepID=UPI00188E4A0C|nr:putative pentatricopeptide repeat-containing protein At3g13770, mitochondrial [Triticum dicoccoides]